MASYAGAYGAGGAADGLRQLLADRLTREKFDEDKRRSKAEEDAREKERRDTSEYRRQESEARARRDEANRSENYEDRLERRRLYEGEQQRTANNQMVRAKERAEDREWGLDDREDQQRFQSEQRQKDRDFQSYMDTRRASRSAESDDDGPLVAIKDDATGQPRLVPRREAIGKTPASTRDQALTEGQSNASGFADRMKFNEDYIRQFEQGAASRGSQLMGLFPRELQPAAFQQYASAKQNWIAANLRKESGAAIGKDEYANADQQYFPQPGEGAAVIEQKRQLRAVAEAAMRRSSGFAGQEQGGAPRPTATGNSPAGPAPGTRRVIQGQPAVWDGQGWVAEPTAPAGQPQGAQLLMR